MPQGSELINQMLQLLELHRSVFGQERVYLRGLLLVVGELFAFKGHWVTDLLRAMGLVEEDWTTWYQVYQRLKRFMAELAGRVLFGQTLCHVSASEVYVIGVDCTQVARDSQHMEGTSWLKNPRNPPWRVGIHRGQRFLNGRWLTLLSGGFSRAIPLRWLAAFPEKAVLKAHELAARRAEEAPPTRLLPGQCRVARCSVWLASARRDTAHLGLAALGT